MKVDKDTLISLLIVAILLLIITILLTSRQKEEPTFCYKCQSEIMITGMEWHGVTEAEMDTVIQRRIRQFGDTLICEKI